MCLASGSALCIGGIEPCATHTGRESQAGALTECGSLSAHLPLAALPGVQPATELSLSPSLSPSLPPSHPPSLLPPSLHHSLPPSPSRGGGIRCNWALVATTDNRAGGLGATRRGKPARHKMRDAPWSVPLPLPRLSPWRAPRSPQLL